MLPQLKLSVIQGKGRGRRLGFPTLNLAVPEGFALAHGIYAGWVWLAGKKHQAAIHFGPIPTFNETEPTLEAYLLDVILEQAPAEVEIQFVGWLRPIESFSGAEPLKQRINEDIARTKEILNHGGE